MNWLWSVSAHNNKYWGLSIVRLIVRCRQIYIFRIFIAENTAVVRKVHNLQYKIHMLIYPVLKQTLLLYIGISRYDICSQMITLVMLIFQDQTAPIESHVWPLFYLKKQVRNGQTSDVVLLTDGKANSYHTHI